MHLKTAIVGSYGSGRTTLARALAERTGLPLAYGSAMADPIGAEGKPVHEWTAGELLQLTVRRYAERVAVETALPGGFISDGSILHEPVYAKTRLVAGSYPQDGADLAAFRRDASTAAYEDVVDHVGLLAHRHAQSYDLVLRLPVEFPLRDAKPPISEAFRHLTDDLLSEALTGLPAPVHLLKGGLDQRVEEALSLLGDLEGSPAPGD